MADISESVRLRNLRSLSGRVDALRRSMEMIYSGTTEDHAKWAAFADVARAYNFFAKTFVDLSKRGDVGTYDEGKLGTWANTVWPHQKRIFDSVYSDVLILGSLLSEYDQKETVNRMELHDLFFLHLRKVVFSRPLSEIDVQNSVEALLIGRGYAKPADYDRETGRVKFSGKEFVPDFIFPKFELALEVKLVKENDSISKFIEQMSADAVAYQSKYPNILFCIYDLGSIRDIGEIQNGLEMTKGVRVCVVKH